MPDIQSNVVIPSPTGGVPPAAPAPAAAPARADERSPEQRAADLLEIVPEAQDDGEFYGEAPAPAAAAPAHPAAPAEAAPTAPDEFAQQLASIARERLAYQQSRRQRKPQTDPQTELAKAVAILAERLNAPTDTAPAPVQEMLDIDVRQMARDSGLTPAEVYKMITEQMKTGKAAKVPRAPRSAEATALDELRTQLEDERAAREELQNRIETSAEQWERQQQQQAQYTTHLQLAQQFRGFVQANKEKYPFTAAADSAEVGETLAIAVANSRGPLTPDQLVGNLENSLRAEAKRYEHLLGGQNGKQNGATPAPAARAATTEHRGSSSEAPASSPARSASGFIVPQKLRGVPGLSTQDEVSRVAAAIDKLEFVADEE